MTGVQTCALPISVEGGGIPDEEGVAETANAIRLAKGNTAVYIDKEADVFLQHKSGGMFQMTASPSDPKATVFGMKDGNPVDGFSFIADGFQKIMRVSMGSFSFLAYPSVGLWMMGDFSDGFNGILYVQGFGIIAATSGILANSPMFWVRGVVLLGGSLIPPFTPAAYQEEGATGDTSLPSTTVFVAQGT